MTTQIEKKNVFSTKTRGLPKEKVLCDYCSIKQIFYKDGNLYYKCPNNPDGFKRYDITVKKFFALCCVLFQSKTLKRDVVKCPICGRQSIYKGIEGRNLKYNQHGEIIGIIYYCGNCDKEFEVKVKVKSSPFIFR